MDRDELLEVMRAGPITITMNDGNSHYVPSIEFAIVSDLCVHVLVDDADGKKRARILPLVTIAQVEQQAA